MSVTKRNFSMQGYRLALAGFLLVVHVTASAEPVNLSGPERDSSTSVDGNVPRPAGTFGSNPGRLTERPATNHSSSAGDSEWERFRKTLRGLIFDQADEPANTATPAGAAASRPGFSSSITQGAYTVPGAASKPAGQNQIDHEILNSARELSAQSGPSMGASANGAAVNAGDTSTRLDPGKLASAPAGQVISMNGSGGMSEGSPNEDMRIPKSKQSQMLEGMLFSQLVDQVLPWAAGFLGLVVSVQLIRSLIRFLQTSQERALRRKAEETKRPTRRR